MFKRITSLALATPRSPESGRKERGATAVEYALMAGLIAAVIVTAVAALGTQVLALFTLAHASLP